MSAEPLDLWKLLGAGGVGMSALGFIIRYWLNQQDTRAARMDANIQAVLTAQGEQKTTLSVVVTRVEDLSRRVENVERDLFPPRTARRSRR